MSPIKNVTNLPAEFRRTERNDAQKRVQEKTGDEQKTAQPEKTKAISKDSVRLSDAARNLLKQQERVGRYAGEIDRVGTIDPQEAKAIEDKIGAGFYSSPEVLEKVAASLAKVPSLAEAGVSAENLTPERLDEIMQKIRDGDYNGDAVVNTIVEKLMNDL